MEHKQKELLMKTMLSAVEHIKLTDKELVQTVFNFMPIMTIIELMITKSFDDGVNKGYALREALEELALDEGEVQH